jgi:hypothetical protein
MRMFSYIYKISFCYLCQREHKKRLVFLDQALALFSVDFGMIWFNIHL